MAALIFTLVAVGTASGAEKERERLVYWVDVRKAALATEDGRAAAAELDREHARIDAELAARENTLAELQRRFSAQPTRALESEYHAAAVALELAITEAEEKIRGLEEKKVAPILAEVRQVITELNASSGGAEILELDRHEPINLPRDCDVTGWVVERLDVVGTKPHPRVARCNVKFFLYVDVERLKNEMKRTRSARRAIEALREDRLREIATSTSGAPPTRMEMFQTYSRQEQDRRDKEKLHNSRMMLSATAFVTKTARVMRGVLFLDRAHNGNTKLTPSCDVTRWLLELEHGKARLDDVARECRCVFLNRGGTKLRIARGCGGGGS